MFGRDGVLQGLVSLPRQPFNTSLQVAHPFVHLTIIRLLHQDLFEAQQCLCRVATLEMHQRPVVPVTGGGIHQLLVLLHRQSHSLLCQSYTHHCSISKHR